MSSDFRFRLDGCTLTVYLLRGLSLDVFPSILGDIFGDLWPDSEKIRNIRIVFMPQDALAALAATVKATGDQP